MPDQQMGTHTHTLGGGDGAAEKGSAWPSPAVSRRRRLPGSTHHLRQLLVLLSWEGKLEPRASLVAEPPEDKRSDRKADGDGQQRCWGRGKPSLEGSLWQKRALAAARAPALGGSASTRHRRPPTDGVSAATELPATPPLLRPAQAPPDAPCPASAHRQRGATPFPARRTGWLAGW